MAAPSRTSSYVTLSASASGSPRRASHPSNRHLLPVPVGSANAQDKPDAKPRTPNSKAPGCRSPRGSSKRRHTEDISRTVYSPGQNRSLRSRGVSMSSSPHKRRKIGSTDKSRDTGSARLLRLLRGGLKDSPKQERRGPFDPLFNKYVTHELGIDILKYLSLHELAEKICLVNKKWHSMIFQSPRLWELVIISRDDPRTPLAGSGRVSWLKTCPVRNYIKDLNIALTMNYNDMCILKDLQFPNLREFSVDMTEDDLSVYHFGTFLQNHQHVQWINGEFSTEQRTRAAVIPLEVISGLRCLGVERLYLNKCLPLGTYPNLKCIGHMRIFDEDSHLLKDLHKSMPSLTALSISIDTASEDLMRHIAAWQHLTILYVLCNLDDTDGQRTFDYAAWAPLRKMVSCKMLMMVNFPDDWPKKVAEILPNIDIRTEQNGLAFWNETEPLVWT